ncbi:hypothetical protein ACQPYA_02070 [Micromonospora sp. CA-263727]|uniref:VHL beta domain-containing protein n=1 Tax=Micromonospora sp. CA-263727 TaxID=3239967 RepID=UPI003D8A3625
MPVVRESRPEPTPTSVAEPAGTAVDPAQRGAGRKAHRLMLAGVAAAVLGLMLTALWPGAKAPPAAAPQGPAGWIGPKPNDPVPGPEESKAGTSVSPSVPAATSSVGGVSSTRPLPPNRASAAAHSPPSTAGADPGTPSARPSSSTSRPASPSPSTRPPESRELTPLSPSRERDLRSVGGGPETSIEFVNLRSQPVIVYWLDYQGRRRQYAVLPPSASHRQHTYVGHPWVVTDRRGRALACFEPTRTPARAVIR